MPVVAQQAGRGEESSALGLVRRGNPPELAVMGDMSDVDLMQLAWSVDFHLAGAPVIAADATNTVAAFAFVRTQPMADELAMLEARRYGLLLLGGDLCRRAPRSRAWLGAR